MGVFDMLAMIGGLVLFLYGMRMLGDGLTRVSGERARRILEKLAGSPVRSVLMGGGITAVIQSSSAVTVMVLGLADSGILPMPHAVGIIMGSNIGTTVTSWIMGISELYKSSGLLGVLRPAVIGPVFAAAGMLLFFSCTGKKLKDAAYILMGFAILIFGMDVMCRAAEPLTDVPGFVGLLTRFSDPIPGMMAGAAVTAALQSSSASIGILQAICATGNVSYGMAVPIILGQNIGTCVTAMLAALGAGRRAKCAALVHLYFNVIGTVLFAAGFYAVNILIAPEVFSEPADSFGIAFIHSAFNIVTTAALLPFSGGLIKLAYFTLGEAYSPAAL